MTTRPQDDQLTDKAFRRLERKADGLAAQIVRRLNEIEAGMPRSMYTQTLIEFFAASFMERDEQAFRWILESRAALKIQEIETAKANLHPPHPTAN